MKNNTLLVGIVILLLISNLFFGYMYFFGNNNRSGSGMTGNFVRGNFPQMQLTTNQIQNVTSFFESTTDINKITDYCENNRMECFYYCREINSAHEYCSQLMQEMPDSQQAQRLN